MTKIIIIFSTLLIMSNAHNTMSNDPITISGYKFDSATNPATATRNNHSYDVYVFENQNPLKNDDIVGTFWLNGSCSIIRKKYNGSFDNTGDSLKNGGYDRIGLVISY